MISEAIKDLLAAAAGPNGAADQGWHAGRVDRLYFSDPKDPDAAGQVDVSGPEPATYVRVELWVRPELAAQAVALVTGETEAIETRLRHELRAELLPLLREQVEREMEREAPRLKYGEEHVAPPDDPRGFVVRDAVAKSDLARRDSDRRVELDQLCKEQAIEEAAAGVSELGEFAEDEADDEAA